METHLNAASYSFLFLNPVNCINRTLKKKKRKKNKTVEIVRGIDKDGRIIRIPSEVIEERMRLMHIDSVEKAIEDVKIMSEAFASSLSNEEKCASDFEKRVLKFLDCDIDVYRR